MPIISIQAVLWLGCAVHILRSGRPWYWFMVISMPVLGPAAYFLFEMLPEMRGDPGMTRATTQVLRKINPERERKRIQQQLQIADTPKNRLALADESLRMGDYQNASDLYQSCLAGVYANDPAIMLGFAQARFGMGDYANCRKVLDDLISVNPNFKSPTGHLLYARTLAGLELNTEAQAEFESVTQGFSGEEARVRHAQFLRKLGRTEQARKVLEESLQRAKLAPGYYRRDQKEWLKQAKTELKMIEEPQGAA